MTLQEYKKRNPEGYIKLMEQLAKNKRPAKKPTSLNQPLHAKRVNHEKIFLSLKKLIEN